METPEFLQALETEGRLLAAAAEEAGTSAKVPTCPQWQVRDLLRHTGAVHRWAASYVAERHTERRPLGEAPDLDGAELVAWYRDSHRHLVGTLADASPDVECWFFLPAPSPLAFWTRRQAHETAVHRVDAESARGGGITPVTPVTPDFATDGIDELLRGFHARSRSRVRTDEPRVLRVRTDDTDAAWTVRLSSEPPVTTRGVSGDAECELSGPAEKLYLGLWNRAPLPSVTGDQALAELWRETSGI
ncbi:maleylpyruvate isomerase family mycothiol-dependent enzyme [Streptomyces coeruleorubidus]|uniref:maleylpyruvate isomerase family mycothiol-dependent enzyme n=1 Tax=Streptomyces coeruleorubidus TaxID=116188 RepID=UPI00237F51BA|nr:maleylpyruvate isomerase family mycothiol-dependent enzyme [Streptomyces coeruleorubidus]WDV49788.1 maleylpyruvate isomerase family mycothiol-dependent enzyme [Streptomyces coeruleorubidus]